MSALSGLRNELRALLGPAVLLRRDQAVRALFICDAPRRLPDAGIALGRLREAGFDVSEEGGLWRIDLGEARRAALIAAVPPCALPQDERLRSLCRSLLSRGQEAPERQPWPPIRQTLLRLDEGKTDLLYRELTAQAAVLKRTHAPLPTAAAYLIAQHEGGRPC